MVHGPFGLRKDDHRRRAKRRLEADGYSVLILDGDDVRRKLHSHLGSPKADIKKNNELIVGLCQASRSDVDVIFVPIISPFESSRARRGVSGERFYEIYFSADLNTVMARDVKGLYAKAKRNEIENMVGYSPTAADQPPQNAAITIHSGVESADVSLMRFYKFVLEKMDCQSTNSTHPEHSRRL